MTKTAEKPYPWGCTYLYSPNKRVTPPPGHAVTVRHVASQCKVDNVTCCYNLQSRQHYTKVLFSFHCNNAVRQGERNIVVMSEHQTGPRCMRISLKETCTFSSRHLPFIAHPTMPYGCDCTGNPVTITTIALLLGSYGVCTSFADFNAWNEKRLWRSCWHSGSFQGSCQAG